MTDGVTPGSGDNLVGTVDVTLLGTHYGTSGPAYLDVGPTSNSWINGLPMTDNILDFEDLVIFAIDYGQVSAPAMRARPEAVAGAVDDALTLERPEEVAPGAPVTVTLSLKGSGALRALATRLAWDAAVVEPIGVQPGAWLTAQGGVAFSARPGAVDAAVLGAAGMSGEGVMATVAFRVKAVGDPAIRIAALDGRDLGNHAVAVDATERAVAPPVPTVTRLAGAMPNPFHGSTRLAFDLAQRGAVELAIFSVDGRRVRTLVSGTLEPGAYRPEWDGRDERGGPAAAGVYYVRLVAGGRRMVCRIVALM